MEWVTAHGDVAAQKHALGEVVYERVRAADEGRAGRVVGMILAAYDVEKLLRVVNEPQYCEETWQQARSHLLESEASAQ